MSTIQNSGPFFGWIGDRFQQSMTIGSRLIGKEHPTAIALTLRILFEKYNIRRPQLIVLQNDEQLDELKTALHFWGLEEQTHTLTNPDVLPFSEIHSNQRALGQRVQWLFGAAFLGPKNIFLATASSLSQKTLHPDVFTESIFELTNGKDLPDDGLLALQQQGYHNVSQVEDYGQVSQRGGVLDVFSPAHPFPVRIELFGNTISSLRFFDPNTQLSLGECSKAYITPPREFVVSKDAWGELTEKLTSNPNKQNISIELLQEATFALSKQRYFPGIEKLLPLLSKELSLVTDYFFNGYDLWIINSHACLHERDEFFSQLKEEKKSAHGLGSLFEVSDYFTQIELTSESGKKVYWDSLEFIEGDNKSRELGQIDLNISNPPQFSELREEGKITEYIESLRQNLGKTVILAIQNETSLERIKSKINLENLNLLELNFKNNDLNSAIHEQSINLKVVHFCFGHLPASLNWESQGVIVLRDIDLLGKVIRKQNKQSSSAHFLEHAQALNFGDIKVGDHLVHKTHGIGIYRGLKMMPVKDVPTEFLEIAYKGNDRLYVPVYRLGLVQKFSGPATPSLVDKLGGQGWQKTTLKVRSSLRDIASQLIAIYAERAAHKRVPYDEMDNEDLKFENAFAFDETEDQLKAISDIFGDLCGPKIMDRLICGDVGFGKTEVAMRAAFKVANAGKQVAVIVPTTILSFQHSETFKKRFKNWPLQIGSFNRFVDATETKKNLAKLKEGTLDIAIGTHRLLSKDITFKNLGLMIIDEEQKFGVRHKERLKQISKSVDTLTLSATPIPRTLNMSLMGIRDLSLITTPPVDRLPTRTYVARYDIGLIKKAIQSEVDRGGQVYFLHNRVASIEGIAFDLRQSLPNVRFAIGHGQMSEDQLEETMIKFVNKEIDVLICTTIIESGTDIPNANTMIINDAQNLGLSQLYQLRGRVGRSKERAYCYLLIPPNLKLDKDAQERLRVIQENTSLGSGFKIAQYDLELRGSGDLLGEKQSGHIEAVGYELYMELLEDAVRELKGEETKVDFDPEINLPIPAFFPDSYVPDIRLRLAYYKILSQIKSSEEVDKVEEELRDQFGPPPLEVVNLLGFMLIRKACKDLGVIDLSGGVNSFSMKFSSDTKVSPQKVVELASKEKSKYSLTPDQRLRIKLTNVTWPEILKEVEGLTQRLLD